MYHPNTYGDPLEEYWSLINDVTLWDVSVERIVEITGPDATAFTNLLTCRDLTKCAVKQGKYMLVTAQDGGIVNDPVLLRVEENRWWLALADSDAGLYAMGVAVNSGMDVHVGHPDVYPVQVQGPKAKDVMRDLFGEWVLDMKYYWCDEAELNGIPVVISRTGWTAVVGYEIYLRDPSRGDDLWERILDAGKPYNIRVTPSSDPRRIEAGIFDWGSDFGLETNPFEVTGLERLVELQDADYIGKDALERIRREGVSRKLVGIEIDGPQALACVLWGRAGRASHRRHLLPPPREEHRIRLGADRPRRAGQSPRHRRGRRRAHRHDRIHPVHRPTEEGARGLTPGCSLGRFAQNATLS
jgi:glycine cleavage system aminomethyltransferase T